jgi:cleavage and polyadenylation specificity factor subunit 3
MYFTCEKMAKTIGRLAEKVPEGGESSGGLLVKKGFTYQIMAPEDLRVFTQLSTANITQRIAVPYSGSFEVIRYRLKQIYESVESATEESDVPALIVHERVTVRLDSESYVTLQWSSDPISDMQGRIQHRGGVGSSPRYRCSDHRAPPKPPLQIYTYLSLEGEARDERL